tara:strand:- start:211 stop:411 length:201 start_codon:yes stop_codon:yes gene_type:complete
MQRRPFTRALPPHQRPGSFSHFIFLKIEQYSGSVDIHLKMGGKDGGDGGKKEKVKLTNTGPGFINW